MQVKLILFILTFGLYTSNLSAATSCSVSMIRALNFGNYDPFSNKDNKSTARLKIRCTGNGNVSYQIQLSTGSSNNYNQRSMSLDGNNSHWLHYNIFRNKARTKIWGDGSGNSQTVSKTKSSPFTKRHTIHGTIPALQTSIQTGSYSDTILVTVDY